MFYQRKREISESCVNRTPYLRHLTENLLQKPTDSRDEGNWKCKNANFSLFVFLRFQVGGDE